MENNLSFVAPEGVYTVAEELIHVPNVLSLFPTAVAPVLVRFPARQPGPSPAFTVLLGTRPRDCDDATNSDPGHPDDSSTPDPAPDLFAHPAKKRSTRLNFVGSMENDLSFVAPEGVYTVAEELIHVPNGLSLFRPPSPPSLSASLPGNLALPQPSPTCLAPGPATVMMPPATQATQTTR